MTRINVLGPVADSYTGEREYSGRFDPEKAVCIEGRLEWDGHNKASVHVGANRRQDLYRTAGGRWVLNSWSFYQGEEEVYEFIDADRALKWLMVNGSDEIVEKYFGEVEEERGPGRPAIGDRVEFRLPPSLRDQITKQAQDGETMADTIRRLLARAVA
jgi:hypothetical protein